MSDIVWAVVGVGAAYVTVLAVVAWVLFPARRKP